jgi:Holliday junction resolvase RusA-like endonuclease
MRVLSKEAQAFKKRVLTEIVPLYLSEITLLDKTAVYDIHYRIYFERDDVMTKTYGRQKGAESQYKRMDLENRLKLLSDTISASIGIDDSQFFAARQEKMCCTMIGGVPQVHAFLRKRDLQEFGF